MSKVPTEIFDDEDVFEAVSRLRVLRVDSVAWETHYINDVTGEEWIKDYPHGELHGGGPPRLRRKTPLESEG